MSDKVEVLEYAYEFLKEDYSHWTTHAAFRDAEGKPTVSTKEAASVCAVGAIALAGNRLDKGWWEMSAMNALHEATRDLFDTFSVTELNDSKMYGPPEERYEKVLEAYELAIKREKGLKYYIMTSIRALASSAELFSQGVANAFRRT